MDKLFPLDPRLSTVARKVRPGHIFADIGTDHGYLAAYLIQSGICPQGYACDIHEKPLQKAVDTLESLGLQDRVATVLCDGLEGLPAGCASDILIAGMGGDLIAKILDTCPWIRSPEYRFILQPMSKPEHLRRRLVEMGFYILEEEGVRSGRFVYPVMTAGYTGVPQTADVWFATVGKLPENPSPGTTDLLSHLEASLQGILEEMERSGARPPKKEEVRFLTQRLRVLLAAREAG